MIIDQYVRLSNYTDGYYLPLFSEVTGVVQVVQGIALITLGNMEIHAIGLARLIIKMDEEGIQNAANQAINGYRLIKLGLEKTLPSLIFGSLIYCSGTVLS